MPTSSEVADVDKCLPRFAFRRLPGVFRSGRFNGIEPSGVPKRAVPILTKRLPQMKHYGDINKIDGAAVPPVDIITGGFCCQDLSVAGKRAGLHGERSGLFFQVIRIIKEMLAATGNQYPKFAVLENVPGMYSSNGGLDFQEVLNELIRIKDETLSVPMPEKGKWSTSGEIVGDGFSVGWRTLTLNFGESPETPPRLHCRRFYSERAGKDIFDESRLRWNPPQGGFRGKQLPEVLRLALEAQSASNPAPAQVRRHVWKGAPVARSAPIWRQPTAVAIENHPADSRVKLCKNGSVQDPFRTHGNRRRERALVMDTTK